MKSILSQLGYTLLAYPNPSIKPLSILERTNTGISSFFAKAELENMTADLFDIFEKDGILPEVEVPVNVPSFNGCDLVENNAVIKTKLLEKLDFAGNAGIVATLKNAKTLLYEFENPQKNSVSSVTLSDFINGGKLKNENSDIADKVKKGIIYVITETLVTEKFTIKDGSSFEIKGEINADILAESKLNLEANHNGKSTLDMIYENRQVVTFGIKIKKILYDKEKRRFSITKKAEDFIIL